MSSLIPGDIKLMLNLIQVATTRGTWKADELETVGSLYSRLKNIVESNSPAKSPQLTSTYPQKTPVLPSSFQQLPSISSSSQPSAKALGKKPAQPSSSN
jgi:hypothetical protein